MKVKRVLPVICAIAVLGLVSACDDKETRYVHVGPNWEAVHNLEPSEKTF